MLQVIATSLGLLVGSPTLAAEPMKDTVCTVRHSTHVRYAAYGYDHYVQISNGCGVAVKCAITTSSNPGALQVAVPARKRVDVLARKGSPSRRFTASVRCQKS